jgi:putative transposase
VANALRDLAWTIQEQVRRKMTALLHRAGLPEASAGAVDRAMRTLGLVGVRRDKGTHTTIPAKDGGRAGDLLDRDFTAQTSKSCRVTDFERHEALVRREALRTGGGMTHHRCAIR